MNDLTQVRMYPILKRRIALIKIYDQYHRINLVIFDKFSLTNINSHEQIFRIFALLLSDSTWFRLGIGVIGKLGRHRRQW